MARLLDAFPEDVQDYISSQVAHSLIGVVSQHLITRADTPGRVLASEVMRNNEGIAACIRSRRFAQIPGLDRDRRRSMACTPLTTASRIC